MELTSRSWKGGWTFGVYPYSPVRDEASVDRLVNVNLRIMPAMSAINFGDKLARDKAVRSAPARKSKPVSVAVMTTKRQSLDER